MSNLDRFQISDTLERPLQRVSLQSNGEGIHVVFDECPLFVGVQHLAVMNFGRNFQDLVPLLLRELIHFTTQLLCPSGASAQAIIRSVDAISSEVIFLLCRSLS